MTVNTNRPEITINFYWDEDENQWAHRVDGPLYPAHEAELLAIAEACADRLDLKVRPEPTP